MLHFTNDIAVIVTETKEKLGDMLNKLSNKFKKRQSKN